MAAQQLTIFAGQMEPCLGHAKEHQQPSAC
jgi:hypothetical protein